MIQRSHNATLSNANHLLVLGTYCLISAMGGALNRACTFKLTGPHGQLVRSSTCPESKEIEIRLAKVFFNNLLRHCIGKQKSRNWHGKASVNCVSEAVMKHLPH